VEGKDRNISSIIISSLIWFISIILLFDVVYLINGSFELFPIQEQQDKLHTAAGFIAIILILIVMGLVFINRKVKRKKN